MLKYKGMLCLSLIHILLNGTDAVTRPIDRLFPELDLAVCSRPHGQDLTVGDKRFTAYAGAAKRCV